MLGLPTPRKGLKALPKPTLCSPTLRRVVGQCTAHSFEQDQALT